MFSLSCVISINDYHLMYASVTCHWNV